jgi:hypothetical protein
MQANKARVLTSIEKYKLDNWLSNNLDVLKGLGYVLAAQHATDALGFNVTNNNIANACSYIPDASCVKQKNSNKSQNNKISEIPHPMLGKRCIIRTYSAGVHIGDVAWIHPENSMEVKLENALRLWKWEGGGLSLSAVANNGIQGGRLNKTGEVYLTNVVEYIPTTVLAEKTYEKFIEN